MDAAQPGAGWTGPGGFIKGKMSHADLRNRRATMWAGKGFFRSRGIVVCAGFTLPFRVLLACRLREARRVSVGNPVRGDRESATGLCQGRFEGGRDVFSTGRAGAVSQARKQHAQIGINFGDSANRGTRAAVGEMLVHA